MHRRGKKNHAKNVKKKICNSVAKCNLCLECECNMLNFPIENHYKENTLCDIMHCDVIGTNLVYSLLIKHTMYSNMTPEYEHNMKMFMRNVFS